MAPPAALLFGLLLLHGMSECHGQCSNMTQLSEALGALLAAYERAQPPATPTLVSAALEVRHATVCDRTSTVRMLADLRMFWRDERLTWNASEWGCGSALVAAERLWLPDIALLNAAASTDAGDAALLARLNATGEVEWVRRLDASAPLDMRLERWPADEQTASFMFSSAAHSLESLDLTLKPLPLTAVYQTGAWELVSVARSSAVWQEEGARRRVLAWQLLLRRRAAAAARAAAAVLAAGALLLAAAALLPPKERTPLAVAAALTAAFSLVSWTLRLPPSASCPLVVRAAAALCACAGVWCAGAAAAQRVAACAAPPPRLLCTLLSKVSTLCRLTSHQESEAVSGGGAGSGAWRAAALLLDRALRAALLLTLLAVIACSFAVLL